MNINWTSIEEKGLRDDDMSGVVDGNSFPAERRTASTRAKTVRCDANACKVGQDRPDAPGPRQNQESPRRRRTASVIRELARPPARVRPPPAFDCAHDRDTATSQNDAPRSTLARAESQKQKTVTVTVTTAPTQRKTPMTAPSRKLEQQQKKRATHARKHHQFCSAVPLAPSEILEESRL